MSSAADKAKLADAPVTPKHHKLARTIGRGKHSIRVAQIVANFERDVLISRETERDALCVRVTELANEAQRYRLAVNAAQWLNDEPCIKNALLIGADFFIDGLPLLKKELEMLRKLVDEEGSAKERANIQLDAIRNVLKLN